MSAGYVVAIAGATGAVGVEMLRVLEARSFPVRELRLLASARSVGKRMTFRGTELAVEELGEDSFRGVDLALFSAGASLSRSFRPQVLDAGALLVDNSSAFRDDPDVPLVVPEVNPADIATHQGVIANPNCSTIIMLVAATYQATSGAGAKAMDELLVQTRQVLDGEAIEPHAFSHRIAFNLIPHIDAFLDNGYTREELKMLNESRKILHHPSLRVSCTCVRVPVLRAHSEALNLEFEQDVSVSEARTLLETAPGLRLVDDPRALAYPMPVDAAGQDAVLVGRLRQDLSRDDARGLDLFVSGDQILKGAALNAVQIAEVALQGTTGGGGGDAR